MSGLENRYPTLKDASEVLAEMVARGLGGLPLQVIVAPPSTLLALARNAGHEVGGKPALMLEFSNDSGRFPVCVVSAELPTPQLGALQ